MSMNTEHLELLITRALDGEISAADRAILDAELAADPRARALLNDYRRIDAEAGAALKSIIDAPRTIKLPLQPSRSARFRPWYYAVPGVLAAAAAVVFFVVPRGAQPEPRSTEQPRIDTPVLVSNVKPPLKNLIPHVPDNPALAGQSVPGARFVDYVEQPSLQPRRLNRHTTRDWIGVVDDSGQNIYLMQNNHRRTRIVPVRGDF